LVLSVRSQNQSKVRRSSVSRNAVWRVVSAEGGVGPVTPVIDVALVHADVMTRSKTEERRSISRMSAMWSLAGDFTKE
jgi:hypothetical protein